MQSQKLSTGQTFLAIPVPEMPVVAIQVWIGVGSHDEQDGERGLAHLHEHMLFKGTEHKGAIHRGVGDVAHAVEAVGGQINAWTSHDQTCYHVVMPATQWHIGLDVLADAVCHPAFDAEELAREIEVVVEEQRRAADDPGSVAFERMFQLAFAGHPYALPILGTPESVRAVTPAAMRQFWRRHYVAENTSIVAAGAFDPTEMHAAVTALFADQPHRQAPPRPNVVAPRPPAGIDQVETAFSEAKVLLSWPIPALLEPDVAALDVAAIALGQGESSRLVRQVLRDKELCNDIGAATWTPPRAGLFTVSFSTSQERLAAAVQATIGVVQALRTGGIDESELDKARVNLLSDATWKRETAQGLAQSYGYYLMATGDAEWERLYHARIAALTTGEVQRAAYKWLTSDSVQVVVLPGKSDAPPIVAADLLRHVQDALRPAPASLALHQPDVLDGIERIVLPSGDVLLVQPDASVPVWGLRVAALGGQLAEDPTTVGRTCMLGQLLTRGTDQLTGDAIAARVEGLAAGVQGVAGRNSLGLSAVSLKTTTDAVLDLACGCLFGATLPEDEIAQQKKVQLEELRHEEDAPGRRAMRAMARTLYGNHPYGFGILGSADSLARLQRPELLDYLRGRLVPGRLVWAISGDVHPQRMAQAIAAHTPTDRVPLPAPPSQEVPLLHEKRQIRLHADKQQAHIVLGFRGATLYEPERYALEVLATALGGQSGRLFLELRDRQSLAYSVGAMNVDGVDPGYFSFYIGTTPDKVPQALAGLYAQLERVRQEPLHPGELERTRASLAGGHQIGLQRRLSRAATLCLDELYGLGRSAWQGHLQRLLAVTAEDVLQVARERLDPQRCVEVILAPE